MRLGGSGVGGAPMLAYVSGGFGLGFSGMLSIVVPLRASELGASIGTIGLILAARAIAELVLAVPLGSLIGRIGARSAYLIGTGWCVAVALAIAVTDSHVTLLFLNAVIGAGRVLAWVSSQTNISGAGGEKARARDAARFSFVSHCSQIVSPALAGAAGVVLGYRLAFLAVALYALGFFAVGLGLRLRGNGVVAGASGLAALVVMSREPRFQSAMLMTFVLLWVPSIWSPFFPLFLVKDGMSPIVAASVVSSMGLVATVLTLVSGTLATRLTTESLCRAALSLSALGLFMSPMVMSLPLAFLPAFLIGVGQGLGLPLLIVLISGAAGPGQRGLALGARAAVNSVASMTGPLALGPLVATVGLTTGFAITGMWAGALLFASSSLATRRSGGPPPL